MNDVVVLTTVLEEVRRPCLSSPVLALSDFASPTASQVRRRNSSAYTRLRALCSSPSRRFFVFANEHREETYVTATPGETPNDRNDRAIRTATAWYVRVCPGARVVLLTQDAACRDLATAEGLTALSVVDYVRQWPGASPQVADLVAGGVDDDGGDDGGDGDEGGRPQKRSRVFADHLAMHDITAGLAAGTLVQGTLRCGRFNPWSGIVTLLAGDGVTTGGTAASSHTLVLVNGREDMNRGMDGDTVVVQLLPQSQWRPAGSGAGGGRGGSSKPYIHNSADAALGPEPPRGNEEETAPEAIVAPGEHFEDDVLLQQPSGGPGGQPGSDGRVPTGKVVGILSRAWRSRGYAGSLEEPQPGSVAAQRWAAGSPLGVIFVPCDRRVPQVRVRTRQGAALGGMRLIVARAEWDAHSHYPSGHYVRTLGPAGDVDAETAALIHEHDIETAPFSDAVMACVPPLPWALDPGLLAAEPHRVDLRHVRTCSVDPPGCRDIDDALSCEDLGDGTFRVGVHIADVSAFVRPGTPLDAEAANRGTSTYLVQRRIDMLPKALTEEICSLKGGTERMTFTVLWRMDADAKVLDVTFTKAVIRSVAALSYAEAQARMDDTQASDPLTCDLRNLASLARKLRAARFDAGALALASPEVKFQLDSETLDPTDVGMYQTREANRMVEEWMLIANCTVADKILASFPGAAMLRRHASPTPRMLEPLLRAAEAAGMHLDVSSSRALALSLDAAVRPDDPYFNKLLRILATRCMAQAEYIASGEVAPAEYHHYGLAAPLYTHFTSPIRRYADLVVHRLLAAALGIDAFPEGLLNAPDGGLAARAASLNVRHRNAQYAGRASVEVFTVLYFRDRPCIADARVTRCKATGLTVFIPRFGIEGPVPFGDDDGAAAAKGGKAAPAASEWEMSADGARVVASDGTGRSFRLFQRCAVRISVVKATVGLRERLVLRLADEAELKAEDLAT